MKPVRIQVIQLGKENFINEINKLFPHINPENIGKFHSQVRNYKEIIVDLESGEILQALTQMGWMLTPYYIEKIPTSDKIDDVMDAGFEPDRGFTPPQSQNKPKQPQFDDETVNKIIDKLGDVGLNNLKPDEVNYLQSYSKYLQDNDKK